MDVQGEWREFGGGLHSLTLAVYSDEEVSSRGQGPSIRTDEPLHTPSWRYLPR